MRPTLSECEQLATPLNDGERRVADALSRLDDGWTIHIQPRLALDVPDFVAIHDEYGVCAIEVKHWSRGRYRQADDGSMEFSRAGVWHKTAEQPRYQAHRYRSTIYDQFFALPEHGDGPTSVVRSVVILPEFSTVDANKLLARHRVTKNEMYVRVFGGDEMETSIEGIVRDGNTQPPTPASIERLRRHLAEADSVREFRVPIKLSGDARNLANNPSGARRRRARGPAGCGKSFGLAARAARLAADGKQVLILTFNTTLSNYLRTLVNARCKEYRANPTSVTCTNFHGFCQRLVDDAEQAGFTTIAPPDMKWFDAIVVRAEQALEAGFRRQFDAVLIDEGQDFTLDWWNMLRHRVVREEGEMLLVADPTQDVYDKQAWTDEEQMRGAGFSGPWTELKGSYRMPSDLIPLANHFAQRYLGKDSLIADVPDDHLDISGAFVATSRRWENVPTVADLGKAIGHEVVRLLTSDTSLNPNDIVFLCEHHRDGLDAVRVIEGAGFAVHHIFAESSSDQARRKKRFWPDAPGVKGCTVHSFKGWEAPALVMGIGTGNRSQRLAYVAMTRLRVGGNSRPAYLSVINSDFTIAGFESKFTEWQRPSIQLWAAPVAGDRVG